MKKLIIVGAGGFSSEVVWLVERINAVNREWDILGFVDDTESLQNKQVWGHPVLGTTDWLLTQDKDIYLVCAIGSSSGRKKVVDKLQNRKYATLIDPSVIMSSSVEIDEGCIICAGNIITVDIKIGKHVIINLDCTVGHSAVLNDFVTLNPSVNMSGNTIINECVEIGTGVQVIEKKCIGDNTVIGAGSVVVKDILSNCTAVGVPAKVIKQTK